jgi:methyltransferase (TIGR00027 family)
MAKDVSGIDAIGRTAFAVAALRAAEHRAQDGLFSDPYAGHFLEAAGVPLEVPESGADFAALMGTQAVVRTRFFDELLLRATAEGCEQVVLVASGMDSRPWRLNWPDGTEVFEIDQEPVLAFKDRVMAEHADRPAPGRHAVAVDLREDWAGALREAGFRAERPTAWLVEGVLYSLDESAADGILATLSELSAPGSALAFDHFEIVPSLRAATDRISPDLTRLWRSGPRDPAAWTARHGWVPDVREVGDVAADFGRTAHPAFGGGPAAEGHSWLVSAVRTD